MIVIASFNTKIKMIFLRSVDLMAQLGGEGLSPFHCLIEGDNKLWLINEMKYLFYYVQILHQNENTTAARIVSDTVAIEQIPNLMRAIGYFPTIKEVFLMYYAMLYFMFICTHARNIIYRIVIK